MTAFGQMIRVEVIDIDRYHREVGRIFLGNRFANMEMVADGFACDTRNTTSRENSPPQKPTPASIVADLG